MATAKTTALTFHIKPDLKEASRTANTAPVRIDKALPAPGGVQSVRFLAEHKKNPAAELSIRGVEKTDETGRLCRLNLAVHGLEGDIRHGGNDNSYYADPRDATGRFGFVLDTFRRELHPDLRADYVLANPPFDVSDSQWPASLKGELCRNSEHHIRNL